LTDAHPSLNRAEDEAELRRDGVALELGEHSPDTFKRADLLVFCPRGSPLHPQVADARRAGVPVMGEIELASRWLSGRIVAVTGTKGKSTTATLTGRMFTAGGRKAMVGGNIGTPLSSQVADSTPDTFHIVEVSSFQLETIETFHPWVAVFLNLSADHLDRHASFEEYAQAKARIFANQGPDAWAVVNADDAMVRELARKGRARTVAFHPSARASDGAFFEGKMARLKTAALDDALFDRADVQLPGDHLASDMLAAATAARLMGAPVEAIRRAVRSYTGVEHV